MHGREMTTHYKVKKEESIMLVTVGFQEVVDRQIRIIENLWTHPFSIGSTNPRICKKRRRREQVQIETK